MSIDNRELIKIFSATLGISPHQITENTILEDIPEWDSLAQLAILSILEQKYNVEWNPDYFLRIKSFGDILDIINNKNFSDTSPATEIPCDYTSFQDNSNIKIIHTEEHSFEDKLLKRLADVIGIERKDIGQDTILSDIPEWDSLANLAVAAVLEDEYNVTVSPESFFSLNSIRDIINVVKNDELADEANDELIQENSHIDRANASFVSIVHNILRHANSTPQKNALIFPQYSISYRQLEKGILSTSALLKEKGIRKGDVIEIYAEKKPEFFFCYFAAHYLGAIVLNIDPAINDDRLHYIESATKPIISIGDRETCHLRYADISIGRIDNPPPPLALKADDIADIMFTTGTTGESKGVPLTHVNLTAAAFHINKFTQASHSDIEVLALPIYHSFGMGRVRCMLSMGATIILIDGFSNTKALFSALHDYKATGFAFVPAAWAYLQQTTHNLITKYATNLRYIEIGSAPMSLEKKRELMDLFPSTRICMHYGLTEASRSSFIEFHAESEHLDSAGKASPNTQIVIMSDTGHILPHNEEGEICVLGKHVMSHYLNTPVNSLCYHGKYFRTGDWGFIDDNEYLHIISRTKDIINSGGKKISPEEVESFIRKIKGIADCACIPAPDPQKILGEVVKAVLVSNSEVTFGIEKLRSELRGKLESYKIPTIIEWRHKIPRTESGKIKRHELS